MTRSQSTMSSLDLLSRTPNFQTLDPATLEPVVAAADVLSLVPGDAVFRSGDPFSDVVYIPVSGQMRQVQLNGESRDVRLGDVLGLTNALDRARFSTTVEAVTDSQLLRIPFDVLDQLEQADPALCNCVHRILARKLRAHSPTRVVSRGVLAQPVRTMMAAPVAVCSPEVTLREAFSLMQARHLGSLAVTGADQKLQGLLTRANLSEAVFLNRAQPDDMIRDTLPQLPTTVGPETPLWQVEDIQHYQRTKYVVVVEDERPVGIVSQTDVVEALMASTESETLALQIAQAESLDELRALKMRLAEEAAEIRETNRLASATVRLLSMNHLAIQRRTIDLTLEAILQRGEGKPPLPYAVIIMGSGGRKEMLLNPDQDNGLIIGDAPDAVLEAAEPWFEHFAHQLNENLATVGYYLCPGDTMARNPRFRRTLSQWQKQIDTLVDRPTEQAARWSNIIFDFDTLYGDDTLTVSLRQHVLTKLKARPNLLQRMVTDDARSHPALGIFNQLVPTSRDAAGAHIDLKRNGLRLITDATRILSLRAGVTESNTTERLAGLVRTGTLSETLRASVNDAHNVMMDLLLARQIDQYQAGESFNTLVEPKSLTERDRVTLRLAMRIVKRFQDRLQDLFGIVYVD